LPMGLKWMNTGYILILDWLFDVTPLFNHFFD